MMTSDQNWEFFLSHVQREAATEAVQLAYALGADRCWLDRFMPDKSVAGMRNGVMSSRAFLCLLTPGYASSLYCQQELAWAIRNKKPIVTLYPAGVAVGEVLASLPETVDDGEGGTVSVRARVQAVDAIMIDAKDKAYFDVALTKIHQRVGTFREALPTPKAGLRQRALKAAELLGHDTKDKHLRDVVNGLAASVAGSLCASTAPMTQKLAVVEQQLML